MQKKIKMRYRVVTLLLPLLFSSSLVAAQVGETRWGVSGTVAPKWRGIATMRYAFDADEIDIQGTDIRIGFVRGRELGGDWGVSFVRKTFTRDSEVIARRIETACRGSFGCFEEGTIYRIDDVALTGIEVHKYVPFATIRGRVQIGMNFSGGIAKTKGTARRTQFFGQTVLGPNNLILAFVQGEQTTATDPRQLWVWEHPAAPLLNIEAAVGWIAAPGFKIKATGGFNFPGYHVLTVGAVYLFGVR